MRASLFLVAVLLIGFSPASAETLVLEAIQDATLIEDPAGALANGSSGLLYVGRTGLSEGALRRALVRFDVAAAVPQEAILDAVSLSLFMWPSHPEPHEVRLHRVQSAWEEGPSSSSGGGGSPSEAGDVTWLHTSYDTLLWVEPGGDFVARASSALEVADTGRYDWPSTNQLVADARLWLHAPWRNFGWLLIGDELVSRSVKNFVSREHADITLRPTLTVTYHLPGE